MNPFALLRRVSIPDSGRVLILAASLTVLVACAPKVVTTGYLSSYENFDFADYKNLKIRKGPDVAALEKIQKVGQPPASPEPPNEPPGPANQSAAPAGPGPVAGPSDAPSTKTLILVIPPTHWLAGNVYVGEDRVELTRMVRQALYDCALFTYPSPVMVRHSLVPNDPLIRKGRPVFVESAVTEVRTGFPPARTPLIAFLGLGSVKFQLEGRIREGSPSGPVIAEYAVRVHQSGGPRGGFFQGLLYGLSIYPKVYSNSYCLEFAGQESAWKVLYHMRRLIPGPPSPEESGKNGAEKK